MIISTHELFPLYVDGKIDKNNAMIQAVGAYERYNFNNLKEVLVEVTKEDNIYAPIHWRKNQRNISNAILEIDMFVYDSDDGDTESEILQMLDCHFGLLQTANWSPELNKYRIFIPLAKKISFDDEQEYKDCYRWLGNLIGLNYDTATTECGRGYIGLANKPYKIFNDTLLDIEEAWSKQKRKIEIKRKREAQRNKIKRDLMLKGRKSGTSQITPEHLINKTKFKEYYVAIVQGNYNNGIMAIIGYFKSSGCRKEDVRTWLINQHFGNADDKYIDKRMKAWEN